MLGLRSRPGEQQGPKHWSSLHRERLDWEGGGGEGGLACVRGISQEDTSEEVIYIIVFCTSWHLTIVLSIVQHLILASSVVYGEGVNPSDC